MPNHVTNIIRFNGAEERIREVLEAIKGEPFEDYDGETKDTPFDFNKVIPMPPELLVTEGSLGDLGERFLKGDKEAQNILAKKDRKDQDEAIELGQAYIENRKKHGHNSWYNWSVENWDTKWNAYDFKPDTDWNVLQFDTAWSHPYSVIEKLSEMFPDVEIDVRYADEDLGVNVAEYSIKDGEAYDENEPDGDDALRLACDIKGYVEGDDFEIESDGTFKWLDGW